MALSPFRDLGLLVLFVLFYSPSFSQGISINTTAAAPTVGSGVDVDFATKGMLIPRVALANSTDLMGHGSLTTGLMVYNNGTGGLATAGYYYWNSVAWIRFGASGLSWDLLGNAGTVAATNFLGNTDAVDLVIRTNNIERMRMTSAGSTCIGATAPFCQSLRLYISGGNLGMNGGTGGIGNYIMGNPGVNGGYKMGFGANIYWDGTNWITKGDGTDNGAWAILGNYGVGGSTSMCFFTIPRTGGGDQTLTNAQLDALERLRIDDQGNGGNLGIGTRTPTTKISIGGLDDPLTGPIGCWAGSAANQTHSGAIRFREQVADFQGAYIKYNGSTDKFFIGMHHAADTPSDLDNITILKSSGNVGLFQTTPLEPLHVVGTVRQSTLASAGTTMVKADANGTLSSLAAGAATQVLLGTGVWGAVPMWNLAGNAGIDPANLFLGTSDAVDFVIATGGIENVRVSSARNVGIGTAGVAASEKLEVCGNVKVDGAINASGNVNAVAGVTCSSDLRYKKDINPLSDALNNVLKLRGVNYYWKKEAFPEKYFTTDKQTGVIAQELEKVYPELVFTDKNGYKSVDYSRLTPILIEAVKELNLATDQQKKILQDQESAMLEQQKINEALNKRFAILEQKKNERTSLKENNGQSNLVVKEK